MSTFTICCAFDSFYILDNLCFGDEQLFIRPWGNVEAKSRSLTAGIEHLFVFFFFFCFLSPEGLPSGINIQEACPGTGAFGISVMHYTQQNMDL